MKDLVSTLAKPKTDGPPRTPALTGELVVPPKPAEALPDLPAEMRAELVEAVKPDFKDIVSAQAELAKGIWVKEFVKDKNGNFKTDESGMPIEKVYLSKPDRDAGQYLINQIIGKPKENMVIDGKVNFVMDV